MAAQKQPEAITEGKLSYLSKGDNIVSKKQFAYDAKTEALSIANTYAQTAYGMDFLTMSRAVGSLDEFSRDHLITHKDGFLRNGYLERRYGRTFPFETLHLPAEPGKPITPITMSQLKMHDDITGRETIELTAALDYEFGRGAEAFIEPDKYEQFVNLHTMKTGEALGRQIKVLGATYCMAAFPAATLSNDIDLVPFLDSSLKPDESESPGASKWFDQSGAFGKTVKKEIFGQVQQKLTNIGYYSPELYSPGRNDNGEVQEPKTTAVNEAATETKKLFFSKDNAKQILKKDLSPFVCHLALTMAIREKGIAMTTTYSPMNMGNYKPYSSTAQTGYQHDDKTDPSDLEILLNPYDYAALKMKISNTSPFGNYTATLEDIEKAGTKIYSVDTMLPGHFQIQHKLTFKIIEILRQIYSIDLSWCLATQQGAHLFLKVYISGFTPWYRGIPLSYIPPNEVIYHNFKTFKQS